MATPKGKVLMVQGTASHVGKSILVTALCRIFRQDGFSVAPFKAQNMSLNSFVTPDGGEIGRAQAVQSEAAGVAPQVQMNPILLKPEADSRSQVVVLGRPLLSAPATDYYKMKSQLWKTVTQALDYLRSQHEVVVIEGAGSPVELNLKDNDIVNMRVARYADAPVLLVADIDRGGVLASLLGTLWLLEPEEKAAVGGLVINKFRGDPSLLQPALKILEDRGGVPVAGVIPYFHDIHIAQEDSVSLEKPSSRAASEGLDVAVVRLPHISNFDDFDPLEREEGVYLRYVTSVDEMGSPDLVVLPGSKTTIADLQWLQGRGLAARIVELHRSGTFVIGICGGYQMLGARILDPHQVESKTPEIAGLGLLPVTTLFEPSKETHQVVGRVKGNEGMLQDARGMEFTGYEIHMGRMQGESALSPFLLRQRSGVACSEAEGCMAREGSVLGTYVHGLFHNEGLRRAVLGRIAAARNKAISFRYRPLSQDAEYDKLAELVRRTLDMDLIHRMVGMGVTGGNRRPL